MKSAKDLTAELKTLEARRETLASDVEAARTDVDTARAGLITGAVKVNIVTSAQSKFTALTEALGALDRTITATRARLDEARSVEQKAADIARAEEIGEEKTRITGELQGILETANEALIEAVAAYTERTTRWVELTRESDAITERRTGFDPSRQRSSPLSDLQLAPVLPFDPAVALALNIESRRRERLRSKEASGRATERERQRQRAA
jgi:small-conductance mechanosensitive channel